MRRNSKYAAAMMALAMSSGISPELVSQPKRHKREHGELTDADIEAIQRAEQKRERKRQRIARAAGEVQAQ